MIDGIKDSICISGACEVLEVIDGRPTRSREIKPFSVPKTFGAHHSSLVFTDGNHAMHLADNTQANVSALESAGFSAHRNHPVYFSNNEHSLSDDINQFLRGRTARINAYDAAILAEHVADAARSAKSAVIGAAEHVNAPSGGVSALVKQGVKAGVRSL